MNSRSDVNRIAGIIIAAGESKRLKGNLKQLLPWRGKPLISHSINVANNCDLFPILVILGAYSNIISPEIDPKKAIIVENKNWKNGKGTSISLGFRSLPLDVTSAIVFVVDQPFLSKNLVIAMINMNAKSKTDIIVPIVDGIQCNPVLFNRNVFPDLIQLNDKEGGRDLFAKYSVEKIYWEDKRILLDIDTAEDFVVLTD